MSNDSKTIIMKSSLIHIALACLLCAGVSAAGAQVALRSERGNVSIEENSKVNMFRQEPDKENIPRNYDKQPPLIPHSIRGYEVTQNFNKCMDCHSSERARETKATPVAKSHYLTRDDKRLKNISPRRYFCLQCHVPQVDAPPLVENIYKPAVKK